MPSYDVAVIGAGVHGCAAAARFAERGARTIVLDRGQVAGGPTGRSSAMCRAYYSNPFLAKVARQGVDILRNFTDWSGGGYSGFRQTGVLWLHGPEDLDRLPANRAALNALGTRVDALTVDNLRTAHPELTVDDLGGATWEPGAGLADPVLTTTGLLDSAKRHGADTGFHDAVRRIVPSPSGIELVRGGDSVRAAKVLIAAGPWTRALALQVGVDLPLTVERHYVTTNTWGAAPALPYGFADVPGGYYFAPDAGAQFHLGQLLPEPQADPDDYRETVTAREQELLAAPAMRRVPAMRTAGAVGGWASLYDVSPDWQPVVGEIAEGVFVDAGTSGHGFKLAPAWGRYVADLVLDGSGDPGLDQFHPDRFAQGRAIEAGYGSARILG